MRRQKYAFVGHVQNYIFLEIGAKIYSWILGRSFATKKNLILIKNKKIISFLSQEVSRKMGDTNT